MYFIKWLYGNKYRINAILSFWNCVFRNRYSLNNGNLKNTYRTEDNKKVSLKYLFAGKFGKKPAQKMWDRDSRPPTKWNKENYFV